MPFFILAVQKYKEFSNLANFFVDVDH